ncbi:hypothetical protein VTN31DRAFT_784 [Thermomyces dupontii]|uniref:uncharacterized protein n=1 Tax=Talaromyces thermophilus TaxID=28565 RepID=UPI003742A0C2
MAQKRGHSEELGVTTSPDTKRSKVEQRSPLQEESDDWTSSSGSSLSSEEEEDGEEDGNEETDDVASDAKEQFDEITTVPGRPRPRIERPQHSELLSRVSSFLPQLKAANEDLERRIAEGNARDHVLDDVPDDDEQGGRPYIEMNLGLGVLEEKREGDEDASENSDDGAANGNVLDRLMGQKSQSDRPKPGIEEVDD